jgi:hypothetical protein
MKRLLVIAVSTVAAMSVAACGASTTIPGSAPAHVVSPSTTTIAPVDSSLIAWLDRPTPVAPTREPPASTVPVAHCDKTMLAVGLADSDGGPALGTNFWRVPLTNISTAPCSLPEAGTTAEALDETGRRVDLEVAQSRDDADRELDPGDRGELVISAPNVCYPDIRRVRDIAFHDLEIALPSGTLALADVHLVLCGPELAIAWQRDGTVPRAGSLNSLNARIESVGDVVPGRSLDYVVELTNPTLREVPLTPCPSYEQVVNDELKSEANMLRGHYELNCGSLSAIAPGSTFRFAMRTTIPSTLHGPGILNWTLDSGLGAYARITTSP